MFISPSSLTLNSILTSGHIPANSRSAAADPFPGVLPLSTPLLPPQNQSTPSSTPTYFSPGSRSLSLTNFSSTMPPGSGISTPSDSPGPTTGTSAGTRLPPSSAPSSDSDVSTSFTSRSLKSVISTSSLANLSSSSPSLTTNSLSVSGFTLTSPMSVHPSPISSTQPSSETDSPQPSSTSSSLPSTDTPPSALSSMSTLAGSSSRTTGSTTTVIVSTTLTTSFGPSSSLGPSSTSTYIITSIVVGQGATATDFVTTSSVLSTQPPGSAVNSTVHLSPGTVAAVVLGIFGAIAFSALWLFCARRRHRELVREAALVPSESHTSRPLDDEILDVDELGYGIGSVHNTENLTDQTGPFMEERYAGILAALHSTEGFGRGNEGGSTGGVYGSRHNTTTDIDGEDDFARASSPTLPLHVLPPEDPPFIVPLSPPPVSQPLHQTAHPVLPPSAYYMASRRKSSPGPEVAAWHGGYSAAPSCYSYYARSQTLGSGSGSGSVDALSRTRTGSEEPLLGIGKVTPEVSAAAFTLGGMSSTATTDPGNRPGLGSAFGGSPVASMYSPSSTYPALQHDTSGSYGTRSASGSGSYGYPRSGTPSSFDVLRSVSSQGALSSAHSQTHTQSQGFRFGFNRQVSLSSGSTGKKTGSYRQSFGVPPSSFRSWRDRGSAGSDKEKRGERQSLRDKDGKSRPQSWTSSTSPQGSVDEKQGKGSPVVGVRAFLGRLRRGGHTPSPQSSNKDLSPTKPSMDIDPEKATTDRVTPPPIHIEAATPHRRRFSFILSNPDPHPPSPYSGVGNIASSSHTLAHLEPHLNVPADDSGDPKLVPFSSPGLQPGMPFPTGYGLTTAPSPAPTEESRLAEGLLHPRLRTQGHSDASLRDFEDYSRPIGGVVKNRLYSTTTFGTQDELDRSPSLGGAVQEVSSSDEQERDDEAHDVFSDSTPTPIARESWVVDDPSTIRHSPVGS